MTATLLSLGAVTVAGYQLRTGDTSSAASAVTASLVEAEAILDEALRRHLALDERTDTFKLYPDGRIYPDAYPITSSSLTVWGRSLSGATPDVATFVGLIGECPAPPQATVTWTGGYNAATLPRTLANAIYDLAGFDLSDSTPGISGVTSVSLGDASVSYAAPLDGLLDTLVPGLWARVRRFRNRWV